MQIFKVFFKISKRSVGIIITYTLIFFFLLEVLAADIRKSSSVSEFADSSINVAIFDNDNSVMSTQLTDYIKSRHNIVTFDYSLDTIRDKMYSRTTDYVLIIPEHFYEKLLNDEEVNLISYKLPDSVQSQFIELQINNFISLYNTYLQTETDNFVAYKKTIDTLAVEVCVSVFNNDNAAATPALVHFYYLLMPYILFSILIMCITPILITMNKEEIKIRTLCSKLHKTRQNIYIALSSFIIGIAVFLFFSIFSIIKFTEEMFTPEGLLRLINCFIYMIVSLSISFLFGTILKNKNFISMISNVIGFGSSFLTGIFVGRVFLSPSVLAIGRLLPAYWYVDAELAITNGIFQNTHTIFTGYIIQLLFAILFFSIGIVCSKSTKRT